ncbi:hypothetical protein QDD76_004939 [Burkholderia cepacia]|jgi:hypothetical protein|uniref:Uncharacterized protein n=1 Tax=Burkholderia contaminans TaxID=488447 RepID=A0ABD7YFV7_9BURK|nr:MULTISPECIES: hypothetical protein [Burkholderia]EKS9798946.1 hypothetical protein [Burkholderia cepacia]EKS9805900.1 hypothetical protein [Burkholderia cepacia]EKS9813448.1 hypothetical protein [Burkholderia cepacia]EKS9820287.1 hypothetical protein [Burkholderia cepacia]EKS9828152.1 hypothetical protein [Burkholderia cepacia]
MSLISDIKVVTGIGRTTIEEKRAFCKERGKHTLEIQDDTRSDGTREWKCKYCGETRSAAEGFTPNDVY